VSLISTVEILNDFVLDKSTMDFDHEVYALMVFNAPPDTM